MLGKDPFPSLDEPFAHNRREESCKELMGGNSGVPTIKNSTLVVSKPGSNAENNKKPVDKEKMWCNYCNKSRHMRKMCWKVHGKPQNSQKFRGNYAAKPGHDNQTTTVEENQDTSRFNKADIKRHRRLPSQLEDGNATSTPNSGSCSMVQSGTKEFISSKYYSNTWIIDLGASEHMTSNSNFSSSYLPCLRK